MGHRARVVGLFATGASALVAVVACNALTGATDLQFDESAPIATDSGGADATSTNALDAGADVAIEVADGADAAPCAIDTMAKTESVSSTPASAVDDAKVGLVPWSISLVSGTGSAHVTLTANQLTHYLRASSFGFAASVPEDAVIRGIQVSVTRTADFPDEVTDYGVLLVKNNLPGGESKTSGMTWAGSARAATYGGAADLWKDPTWTAPDIRSVGFGVALAARGIDAAMTDVQVTQMTVTVSFVRCLK